MHEINLEEATVRIVRLKTGQDILCGYVHMDGFAVLDNPLQVMLKKTSRGMVMLLAPWLPIELIENNSVVIEESDILAIMEPKASLVVYYNNSVEKFSLSEEERDEFVDKDFSIDEDYDTDVEELLGVSKKSVIH